MKNSPIIMVGWVTSFILMLSSVAIAAPAPDAGDAARDTNREIMRTYANHYIRAKRPKKAQEVIRAHLESDTKDAYAWNLLGLVYLSDKQIPQAARSFYRAAKFTKNPDRKGIYLYHYADTLAQQGDVNKARKVLARAEHYGNVSKSASDAMEVMEPNQALPELRLAPDGRWNLLVSLSSGYDTNVSLVSDSSLATSSQSDIRSPVLTPALISGYSKGIAGGLAAADLYSALTYNTKEAVESFNTIYGSLDLSWAQILHEERGKTHRFGNKFELTFNQPDGFEFFNWVEQVYWNPKWTQRPGWTLALNLPLRYQKFEFTEGQDNTQDDRTGFGTKPALTQTMMMGPNTYSVGLTYEFHFANGDNFKSHTFSVPLQWTRPLLWKVKGTLGLTLSRLIYPRSDSGRQDNSGRVSFRLNRKVMKSLFGSIDYSFRRNNSTVSTAIYSKHVVKLTLTYAIL